MIVAALTTLAMFKYDLSDAGGPMHTDSSASSTPSESRSASECASTVGMPSSLQARMMRTAISPRLATSTLRNIDLSAHHEPAVDVEHLPRDVGGLLARQE